MRHRTLALAAVLILFASTAAAQTTPTARLVYSRSPGAESCPDEDALRQSVATRVGYDPFFAWAKKTIVATMSPSPPQGFVASVRLVDEAGLEHGARELRAPGDCASLLDAAALAIAIAIDPRSLVAPVTTPEGPPSEPTPPSATTLTPNQATQEAQTPPTVGSVSRTRTFHIEGTAGPAVSFGVAPVPAAGLSIGSDLGWGHTSLGLEGRIDAPAGLSFAGRVSSWLAVATLVPCGHLGVVFACAVVQAGSMRASFDASGVSKSIWWGALGGRIGVETALSANSRLRVSMDVVADLAPPQLWADGLAQWTAPTVAGTLATEVAVPFL